MAYYMPRIKLGDHEIVLTLTDDGMLGVMCDDVPKGSIRIMDPVVEAPKPVPDAVTPDTEEKIMPPGWEMNEHGRPVFKGEPPPPFEALPADDEDPPTEDEDPPEAP